MKCKYCDYENPEGAIVCECCGATLATQKPMSYYKKQAKKKVKEKKEKRVRAKSVSAKTEGEAEQGGKAPGLKVSKKAVAVCVSLLALAVAAAILVPYIMLLPLRVPVMEKTDEEKYDEIFSVYDPDDDKTYFLLGGRVIPNGEGMSGRLSIVYTQKEMAIAEGEDDHIYYIDKNSSKKLALTVEINGSQTNLTTRSSGVTMAYSINEDGKFVYIQRTVSGTVSNLYGVRTLVFTYSVEEQGEARFGGEFYGYADYPRSIGSEFFFYVMGRLYIIDGKDGKCTLIGENTTGGFTVSQKAKCCIFDNNNATWAYFTETKETVKLADGEYETARTSPNGSAVAFTSKHNNVFSSYVLKDGVVTHIGDGFLVRAVTDDGSVVYGTDSSTNDIYSSGIGKEVKRLATKASFLEYGEKQNELIFICEGALYLSVDGEYPYILTDNCSSMSILSGCKNGFAGGIISVRAGNNSYLCRVKDDYSLDIIDINYNDTAHLNDGRIFLYEKNGLVYKCEEGKNTGRTRIGFTSVSPDVITPNGLGSYDIQNGRLLYTSVDGKSRIISDKIYYKYVRGSIQWILGENLIFLEKNLSTSLPNVSEEKYTVDGKEHTALNIDEDAVYSLYYSRNGGEKKLIEEDVAAYKLTEKAIYIYKLNENSKEDEIPLYDVYAGTNVNNIKLLFEGVEANVG